MPAPSLIPHELVCQAAGLRVRERDVREFAAWTAGRVRALALGGEALYAALLAEDSGDGRRERELLTVRFTTGETYFYRDAGQFELLADRVLPELIQRRGAERSLRIWSAGCASGEEAYSLAMLVDQFSPQLAGWNVLILGTDIDSKAIAKARRGSYGSWSFRALDSARKERYFQARGDQWTIAPSLRDMVTYRSGDLLHDPYPDDLSGLHDMDLIVCRNVFIYLEPEAAAGIAAKFADTLAEDGYLMTGHSELFGHPVGTLRTRVFPESVVFQKSARPTSAAVFASAPRQATIPSQVPQNSAAADLRQRPLNPGAHKAQAIGPRAVQPVLPAQSNPEDIETLMGAAWREANRGARDAAEQTCRKAIVTAGFDPRPYYLLAQLAQEHGDAAETKALLKKAIYLDPGFVAAYLELGALYACEGDAGRARRMHQTARAELNKLPPQTTFALYGDSTAAEILCYVERLLAEPAAQAPGEAAVKYEPGVPSRSKAGTHG